jgi:hypothetical protein
VFLFVVGAVLAVTLAGGDETVGGHAVASNPPPITVPPAPQDGWTTLSNPASGLSYQIPPANWSTSPQDGSVAQVTLAQGAERSAYTCGKPPERFIRGVLGSGSAPGTDPATLAEAVAQAAATQYYSTDGAAPPTVTVDQAQPVTRKTDSGATLRGATVRAIAHQHADPCLAGEGEVLVFVLRFPDHDGVLLVNADVAGGPASPAPATDRELMRIVSTARPTS